MKSSWGIQYALSHPSSPTLLLPISPIPVIDIVSFYVSLLDVHGPVPLVRYMRPRNVAPLLSTLLDETQQPLGRAEEINAVPPHREYKVRVETLPVSG